MEKNGKDTHHQKGHRRIQQHRCKTLRRRYFRSTSVTLANASETSRNAFSPKICKKVIKEQRETSKLERTK